MGTKYTTVAVSGYNSSPPSDDASQSESNKVKWSTIKTKLPDPLKTAIEAVNSSLVTAFDQSVRSVTAADSTVAGDHNRTIQIASTVTASITISLGDAATMAAGYIVTVANQSNVACVVGRATASNTINGVTASVSIAALESITFIVNSATNGYIIKSRDGATKGAITASNLTMSTARLLGRTTASTGAIEEVSVDSSLTLSATTLSLATNGVTTAKITDANVTGPKLSLGQLTNSLGADVALNNTASWFSGPAVAQGTVGTWFFSGTVTMEDTSAGAIFYARLTDGTTIIASGASVGMAANNPTCITLSGYLTNPAGNVAIQVKDISTTNGQLRFNETGNSKDCTLSAFRIG